MSGVYEDPKRKVVLQDPKEEPGRSDSPRSNVALWIMDSAVIETEEIDAADLLSDAAKGGG